MSELTEPQLQALIGRERALSEALIKAQAVIQQSHRTHSDLGSLGPPLHGYRIQGAEGRALLNEIHTALDCGREVLADA